MKYININIILIVHKGVPLILVIKLVFNLLTHSIKINNNIQTTLIIE